MANLASQLKAVSKTPEATYDWREFWSALRRGSVSPFDPSPTLGGSATGKRYLRKPPVEVHDLIVEIAVANTPGIEATDQAWIT